MKKRTIWFIMLGFMALTLILNIGLKKKVIKGQWIGIRHSDSTVVALKVDNGIFYLLEGGDVDSGQWSLNDREGRLSLTSKSGVFNSYYVQFSTFDTLLLSMTPFPRKGTEQKATALHYSFVRADKKQWDSEIEGAKK